VIHRDDEARTSRVSQPLLITSATGSAVRPRTIRVASVPANHVYVRHLSDPSGRDGVVRLADVPLRGADRVPGGWWPPGLLEADWVAENRGTFDVFHVHFGFDAKPPEELRDLADALDAAGVPLVITVHDLRNPHHPEPGLHAAQLDVLVERAAAVVTLTPGAAHEIERRWGRSAEVLPHPHVVDAGTMARPRPSHDGFVVGLHAKSLRSNMDVLGVARPLAAAVDGLPGARLRIDLHHEVSEPGGHHYSPGVVTALRGLVTAHDAVELHEHDYFTDAELWDYLLALDACVLPYRFGTHSGWLEACHDLGTAVIAPSCGFYAEQQECLIYGHDEDGLDADSLVAAVRHAYAAGPARRASVAGRERQRQSIAAAHRALYERLLR
jgi:hypothetical protein